MAINKMWGWRSKKKSVEIHVGIFWDIHRGKSGAHCWKNSNLFPSHSSNIGCPHWLT